MNHTNPTHCKPLRPKTAALLAFAAGCTLVFVPVHRAAASWIDPIIFDPWAYAEHVQEVAQLGVQISSAAQELENQLLDMAHLDYGGPNDNQIVAGVENQLDSSLYSAPNTADQLNARYPADMSNVTWNQYQSDESTWTEEERESLVENRQLENQVYQDMEQTTQQIQQIVEASNSAPGETAAIQGHNDLLALASGELAKLQALKAARSRLATEKQARQQSELNYAAAERERVRADWDAPATSTETVVDPFQN